MTEAEYKLQLAELDSRLTKERQRRALAVADLEIKRAQAAAENFIIAPNSRSAAVISAAAIAIGTACFAAIRKS